MKLSQTLYILCKYFCKLGPTAAHTDYFDCIIKKKQSQNDKIMKTISVKNKDKK